MDESTTSNKGLNLKRFTFLPNLKANCIILFLLFTFYFILFSSALSQPAKLGDVSDGSRAAPVHLIQLIDQDSSVIYPDEQPLLPFSMKRTCAPCHNYEKIGRGWHFNAGDSGVVDGRAGQPFIYSDPYTATQIPISLRGWKGILTPQQIGLDEIEFAAIFGKQTPGGGMGDNEEQRSLEKHTRWQVSGDLEVNCLSCHDAEPGYDQAEYAAQVGRQNFRWAATAASALAEGRGSAKDLPDNYDIYWGIAPDDPMKTPRIFYDSRRFNDQAKVFFDLTRKVKNERCYFCHSTKIIDANRSERWQMEEDVHLKSGMICVDCHRHGLDHQMTRGYEGEAEATKRPQAEAFTCAGCHLGNEGDAHTQHGRLGAPRPEHKGIPTVHFERLTCTACHSGNWPADTVALAKTSIAHGLGQRNVNKSDRALPHVYSTVFVEQEDGIIAPHNLLWPAFWAELDGDSLKPISKNTITSIAAPIIAHLDSLQTGDWPTPADSTIIKVIDSLKNSNAVQNEPVYVSAGQIFKLNKKDNSLTPLPARSLWRLWRYSSPYDLSQPYAYPIAHDVRPAAQSLGVNGCSDCHSAFSNFFFAKIPVDAPFAERESGFVRMYRFADVNPVLSTIFSMSFLFRPWLKFTMLFSMLIITMILLYYAIKGLRRIIHLLADAQTANQ